MTTPAAWVEAWRGIPSNAIAVSMSFFTRSSSRYISASCLLSFNASCSVMCNAPGPAGTSFATTSTSA